jgi:hypothetical protein
MRLRLSLTTLILAAAQLPPSWASAQLSSSRGLPSDVRADYDDVTARAHRAESLKKLQAADQELADSRTQLAQARSAQNRAQAQYDETLRQLNQVNSEIASYQESLRRIRERSQRLDQIEIPEAGRNTEISRRDLDREQRELERFKRELEIRTREKEKLSRELEDLKKITQDDVTSYEAANRAAKSNKAAIEKLQESLLVDQEAIKTASEKKKAAEAALMTASNQLKEKTADLVLENSNLQNHQQSIAEADKALVSLKEALARAQEANNQDEITKLKSQITAKEGEKVAAQSNANRTQKRIDLLKSEIAKLESEVAKQQKAEQDASTAIAQIEERAQKSKTEIKQRQADQPGLDKQVAETKTKYDIAQKVLNSKAREIEVVERIQNDLSQQIIPQQHRRTEEFRKAFIEWDRRRVELDRESRELAESKRRFERSLLDAESLKAQLERTKNSHGNILDQAKKSTSDWEAYTRGSEELRNKAKSVFDQDEQRLAQVLEFRNQAKTYVESIAREHARGDGTAEGRRFGSADGAREGTAVGEREGESQGRREARAKGDAVGYAEGLREGEKLDKISYDRGYSEGVMRAQADADNQGRKEEEPARIQREKEIRNRPRNDVVIGDNSIIAIKHGGTQQSSKNEPGDRSEYKPRPANYPHPDITSFYLAEYDLVYMETKTSVYRDTKAIAFDNAKRDAFERKRKEFENNQTEMDIGRATGISRGAREKGDTLAYKLTFQTELDKKRGEYVRKGQQAAEEFYSNNAVVELKASFLREANSDSVFRPGEVIAFEITGINYGAQSKNGLQTKLTLTRGSGIQISAANQMMPSIPGKSNVSIRGQAVARIDSQARPGTEFGLRLDILDNSVSLHQNDFTNSINFPTSLALSGFDGILIPGKPTKVTLNVSNRSTKAQTLRLGLKLDESKIELAPAAMEVTLGAGMSDKKEFLLTGKPEANFESVKALYTATQNGDSFAQEIEQNVTIIRRHEKNPGAKGLILSGDLSKGGGKALFEALDKKLDTWDLRVDGTVEAASKIETYVGRVIHIMAESSLSIDSTTAQTLRSFVSQGGSLMIWGTELGQDSTLVGKLGDMMGISKAGQILAQGSVQGSGKFQGVAATVSGEAALLNVVSARASHALTSDLGNIGVAAYWNEFTDKIARVVTIGAQADQFTKDGLLVLIAKADELRQSFAAKLAAAQTQKAAVTLVLDEVIDELVIDSQRTDVEFYKNNKAGSRLIRATETLLGPKVATRETFRDSYPVVAAATASLEAGLKRIVELDLINYKVKVKDASFNSKESWADNFCKVKPNFDRYNQLCRF